MTTAVATDVMGDLILARLLVPGKGAPRPKALRQQISRLFAQPPGEEAWQAGVDRLVAAGLLTVRPYRLTDAGRARALGFLELSALPPRTNWQAIQARYLVPRALGLSDGDEEVRRRAANAKGLVALLLKTHFGLPVRAGTTPAKALEVLVCKELGFPDANSLKDVRRTILRRLLDGAEPPKADKVPQALARKITHAHGNKAQQLREAILRRWLGDGHAAAELPPPTAAKEDVPEAPAFDLPAFAATVRAAARDCPTGRFGDNKVFISHVWRRLRDEPSFPQMDLPAFKARLVEANRARLLSLSRADLVHLMDPDDVRESETVDDNAHFHFLLIERDRP